MLSRLVTVAAHEATERTTRVRLGCLVAMVRLEFPLSASALLSSVRLCADSLEESSEPLVIFTTGRTDIKPRALVRPQIKFSFL